MKKIFILLTCISIIGGAHAQKSEAHCDPAKENAKYKGPKTNATGSYGTTFEKGQSTEVKELPKMMEGKNEQQVKIKGTVKAVCQVKGCWMQTDLGNGQSMRITFKDYSFFVPKDCSGKTFYAVGKASWETTSVEMLRHYAEDAGKSKKEIEAIKEPQKELVFEAEGVQFE